LLVLGLAQALSNLGYATAAWIDPAKPTTAVATLADAIAALGDPARALIYSASMIESFTSGLGTAAFLSFLMNICDKEHAAVQYAALSALFGLSRDVAGAFSGWAVHLLGYATFFGHRLPGGAGAVPAAVDSRLDPRARAAADGERPARGDR
jgi:PAT family beta-lactamase induction signal transducer AmpG